MVYILSPRIREVIPAHLAEYALLFDKAEGERIKKKENTPQHKFEFDHCLEGNRKYIADLDLNVTKQLGDNMIAALNGTEAAITFAYPFRPKNDGEQQNQQSRTLSLALAEFYGARYPHINFRVVPFYQLQDKRRTRYHIKNETALPPDVKLAFSNRSRFAVHDEISLEGQVIIPVDHAVESGGTFVEMVSCIVRHGGHVPFILTQYATWGLNFAQSPETRRLFNEAVSDEQKEELEMTLQNIGLSHVTLTDGEMNCIMELGIDKAIEGLRNVRPTNDELTEEKFTLIFTRHNSLIVR